MNRFVWILTCALLLMMTQAGIAGEIYKYTDKSGNLRFTDDISTVPEKDRSEINTIQSVDTKPSPTTEDQPVSTASRQPDVISTSPEGSLTPADESTGETGPGGQTKNTPLAPNKSNSQGVPNASEYQTMKDQFDQEKKQFDQQITRLQAEKKQLSNADLTTMTGKELDEHEEKENDLNDRIDQLKSDQSQFLERVRQFNERIKSKQTEKPEQANNSPQNK